MNDTTEALRCRTAYEYWTSLWTAVTLACGRTHGQDTMAELEFRSLRKHQKKHFLEGLQKLGLGEDLPDIVRCGRYHYFSNSLGGLPMEYVEEPDRVWIRYRPPFWIGDGVTLPSGGPAALSARFGYAAFRGWHGNNGVMLGNPRLAYVQTQNLTDGDPFDAGYFKEFDRDLAPDETWQRSPGEWGPEFDPDKAPTLPSADWPEARRWRALRNYAVDHTATRFGILSEMLGVQAAAAIVEHAFRMVQAQRWETLPGDAGLDEIGTPLNAAKFVAGIRGLLDEKHELEADGDRVTLRFRTSRMWRDEARPIPEIDQAIARAWSGTLPLHGWGLQCQLVKSMSGGDDVDEWRFDSRGRP